MARAPSDRSVTHAATTEVLRRVRRENYGVYGIRKMHAGANASVGSTGDSSEHALAEAFNSLFKAELVRQQEPGWA